MMKDIEFKPGHLLVITKEAVHRSPATMTYLSLKPGDVALVVEVDRGLIRTLINGRMYKWDKWSLYENTHESR
jgi:hypothetical protein